MTLTLLGVLLPIIFAPKAKVEREKEEEVITKLFLRFQSFSPRFSSNRVSSKNWREMALFPFPSLIICVILAPYLVHGFYPKVSIVNDDKTVSKWSTASKNFDTLAWSQRDTITKFLDKYLSSESSKDLSSGCKDSLTYLDNGLRQRKVWSYECKFNPLTQTF